MKSRMTLITSLTRQALSWNDWFLEITLRADVCLYSSITIDQSQTKICTSVPGRTLGIPISIWASIQDIENCMF